MSYIVVMYYEVIMCVVSRVKYGYNVLFCIVCLVQNVLYPRLLRVYAESMSQYVSLILQVYPIAMVSGYGVLVV